MHLLVAAVLFASLYVPQCVYGEENMFDEITERQKPGEYATLKTNITLDLGRIIVKIKQNEKSEEMIFYLDDKHIIDCMGMASKDGDEKIVWARYCDKNAVAKLTMTKIYEEMEEIDEKEGMELSFLVSEVHGNNVSVEVYGKKDGKDIVLRGTVPVEYLEKSKIWVGCRNGESHNDKERIWFYQNDTVFIYVLGFECDINIEIKDEQGQSVKKIVASPDAYLVVAEWKIPSDISTGNYSIIVDATGKDMFEKEKSDVMMIEIRKFGHLPKEKAPYTTTPIISSNLMPLPLPIMAIIICTVVGIPIGIILIRKKRESS